jgi:hypothetical protein
MSDGAQAENSHDNDDDERLLEDSVEEIRRLTLDTRRRLRELCGHAAPVQQVSPAISVVRGPSIRA